MHVSQVNTSDFQGLRPLLQKMSEGEKWFFTDCWGVIA